MRAALNGTSYTDACARSEAAWGKRLSKQCHAIMWRIREVDEALRRTPELQGHVREIHPELCFYAWSGRPMQHAKRTPEGKSERLALVDDHFRGAFDNPTLATVATGCRRRFAGCLRRALDGRTSREWDGPNSADCSTGGSVWTQDGNGHVTHTYGE